MKVLITGGGTTQKIDQMRTITNKSSGRTSVLMAEAFSASNEVTLLLADNVQYHNKEINIFKFDDVQSLKNSLLSLKREPFDLIIHAAAVSDYELVEVSTEGKILNDSKIPSGLSELVLKLKPTEKIINSLKTIWPKAKAVGFKLTSGITQEQIQQSVIRVINNANLDLIVHNDLEKRRLGFDEFTVYDSSLNKVTIDSINDLVSVINNNLKLSKDIVYDSLS